MTVTIRPSKGPWWYCSQKFYQTHNQRMPWVWLLYFGPIRISVANMRKEML